MRLNPLRLPEVAGEGSIKCEKPQVQKDSDSSYLSLSVFHAMLSISVQFQVQASVGNNKVRRWREVEDNIRP